MLLRLAAISLIFVFTSIAWIILGSTIAWRTDENSGRLRGSVTSLWGAPHAQKAPFAESLTPPLTKEAKPSPGRLIRAISAPPSTSNTVKRTPVVLHLQGRVRGCL
jgi:hypothetical protein